MTPLFAPLTLRSLTLPNRICVSPMQQYIATDGFANDWHLVHLGSRAVGGAGLIITETATTSPEGRATRHDIGIWKDEHIENWQRINRFVHEQGSKIAMQIGHFGSKASKSHPENGFQPMTTEEGGWQTISSSAVAPYPGMSLPKAMSQEDIQLAIRQFAEAAYRAVEAGFDAIEIHGAHGYLIHEFYSELINQRTDQYGGSFENRIRFLQEIVVAIRNKIPESMPLLLRISAVDFVDDPKAWSLEDSIHLAKAIQTLGVDLITASGGGFGRPKPSELKPGFQVPFAEAIKKEANILTGAVGLITTPTQANEIIAKKQADLAILAREHLRNPYFSIQAALELGAEAPIPIPYKRAY